MQQIKKYINDVTPRNPFGNRISQRIPQEVERGVYGGKTTDAIDLLFSRISESAVPAPRRSSEEGRREIEERKKEALKGWAIATGNWHTDLSAFTDDKEPFAQGTDSKVYTSKDGGYVIKASKGKPYGKRFRADIDNVALFNHIFPNSKYDILGYGEIDGNFVRILRQPVVDFSEDASLSEDERVAYMAELGFKPLNKENTAFSNGDFVAADLQKANIVKDAIGNISIIDADMKLHTTDIGGNYSYTPVEEDVLDDDVLYRSDDEMPNFKAKYGLSGVGPTAVIQNENDLIQLKKVVDVNTHQALEDDFKAPRVYGSAYGNHNFIVIFSNKTTATSYTSRWWHEAAHIAYRKLNLSNKEELGLHALEWMKRHGGKFRDHYDTIINIRQIIVGYRSDCKNDSMCC